MRLQSPNTRFRTYLLIGLAVWFAAYVALRIYNAS